MTFYIEYYDQNPLFKDKIVCNEHLDGLLKGCFKARMSFLIVLGTLILTIPAGILKNVEFYRGLMLIFCGSGFNIDHNRIALFRAQNLDRSYLENTSACQSACQPRSSGARLGYGQHRKSFICNHKRFNNNKLQKPETACRSEG